MVKTTMIRYIPLEHMDWPPQSPDFNIIDHLWCVLVRQVRNRYLLLACLKELEQVLMAECRKISLDELKLEEDQLHINY